MKKIMLGVVIGVLLSFSTTAIAAVKQYILTEVSYPILVDGSEYSDKQYPILNYNGITYIPLSKIGDLAGLNYKWNDNLKRVEIFTDPEKAASSDNNESETIISRELTEQEIIKQYQENTKIEVDRKTGLKYIGKDHDGTDLYAFEVYDKDGRMVARYADSDDSLLVIAQLQRWDELPPRISEGWINSGILNKIYSYDIAYEGDYLVIKTSPAVVKQQEFLRLALPPGFKDAEKGETTSNGVRVKKFNNIIYFNINDLMDKNIIY